MPGRHTLAFVGLLAAVGIPYASSNSQAIVANLSQMVAGTSHDPTAKPPTTAVPAVAKGTPAQPVAWPSWGKKSSSSDDSSSSDSENSYSKSRNSGSENSYSNSRGSSSQGSYSGSGSSGYDYSSGNSGSGNYSGSKSSGGNKSGSYNSGSYNSGSNYSGSGSSYGSNSGSDYSSSRSSSDDDYSGSSSSSSGSDNNQYKSSGSNYSSGSGSDYSSKSSSGYGSGYSSSGNSSSGYGSSSNSYGTSSNSYGSRSNYGSGDSSNSSSSYWGSSGNYSSSSDRDSYSRNNRRRSPLDDSDFGAPKPGDPPKYAPRELTEVLRFSVTPEWIFQHWPRVSTGLSQIDLHGYRVPLVTGTSEQDLAGSLTYYFDKNQQLERILFKGTTGDPHKLVMLLTTYYGFTRQKSNDPGLHLYQVKRSSKTISELRIKPSKVVRADSPRSRYQIDLAIARR